MSRSQRLQFSVWGVAAVVLGNSRIASAPEISLEIQETSLKKTPNKLKVKKTKKNQEQTNKTSKPQKNDSIPTLQYFKILIHPETDFSSVPHDELTVLVHWGRRQQGWHGCLCFYSRRGVLPCPPCWNLIIREQWSLGVLV